MRLRVFFALPRQISFQDGVLSHFFELVQKVVDLIRLKYHLQDIRDRVVLFEGDLQIVELVLVIDKAADEVHKYLFGAAVVIDDLWVGVSIFEFEADIGVFIDQRIAEDKLDFLDQLLDREGNDVQLKLFVDDTGVVHDVVDEAVQQDAVNLDNLYELL